MRMSSVLSCLLCMFAATASGSGEPALRPNVVLLIAEDLSPRLGVYGDPIAETPNLDFLAAEGVRFTRAFTTSGVCATSRAAMIMGVHQNHWGAGHMRAAAGGYVAVPPASWKAFPEVLRAAGYYVTNNGKTDYQMGTTFGGAYGGPESIWDDDSADDWRGRAEGQPFFSTITFMGTHESQVWETWDITSLTKFAMAFMRIPNHWQWGHETDPSTVVVPPYYPDTPTVRADIARHYNNVAVMDRQVGEVLRKLEEDGVAKNTIVLFISDHGDGLPRAKRWLYDSGTRIPLIVRWPSLAVVGEINDELVSGVDLAPTLLAAAGITAPEHMEGRVFLGPGRSAEPPYVFAARDRIDEVMDRVRSVRSRQYKYVRHLLPDQPYMEPSSFRDQMPMMKELWALAEAGQLDGAASLLFRKTRDKEELFDTEADPHEIRNLVAEPRLANVLNEMREVLDARLARGDDLGLLPEAELAERFWPSGEQPTTASPRIVGEGQAIRIENSAADASRLWRRQGDSSWQLYREPISLGAEAGIEAIAVRYGYRSSDVVQAP